MKSVVMSLWLLTTAVGNVLDAIITGSGIFTSRVSTAVLLTARQFKFAVIYTTLNHCLLQYILLCLFEIMLVIIKCIGALVCNAHSKRVMVTVTWKCVAPGCRDVFLCHSDVRYDDRVWHYGVILQVRYSA